MRGPCCTKGEFRKP